MIWHCGHVCHSRREAQHSVRNNWNKLTCWSRCKGLITPAFITATFAKFLNLNGIGGFTWRDKVHLCSTSMFTSTLVNSEGLGMLQTKCFLDHLTEVCVTFWNRQSDNHTNITQQLLQSQHHEGLGWNSAPWDWGSNGLVSLKHSEVLTLE